MYIQLFVAFVLIMLFVYRHDIVQFMKSGNWGVEMGWCGKPIDQCPQPVCNNKSSNIYLYGEAVQSAYLAKKKYKSGVPDKVTTKTCKDQKCIDNQKYNCRKNIDYSLYDGSQFIVKGKDTRCERYTHVISGCKKQ